jgi:uncharacterized protein
MKYILYRDRKRQFRWKLLSRNNKIIAIAGESFTRKANCLKSIDRIRRESTIVPILDKTKR